MSLKPTDKIVEDTLVESIIGSRVRMRTILQIFEHSFKGTILDCGCGSGANSQRLVRENCEGAALDIVERTLLKAR